MAYIPDLPKYKEKLEKNKKEYDILGKTLIGVLIVIALVLVYTGITYAYWTSTYSQVNANKVTSGCFDFTIADNGADSNPTSINLINTYPMSEKEAMRLKPYTFTITNTCSTDMHYNVTLNTTGSSDLDGILNYKLIYDGNEIGPKILNTAATYEPYNNYTYKQNEEDEGYNIINSYILTSGSLSHATMNAEKTQIIEAGGSRTYQLYLWIDESVEDPDTMGKNFEGKIIITAGSQKVCRRATELHTEICNRSDNNGCKASGYEKNAIITYGNLGTKGTLASGDAFDCDVDGDGTYNKDTERFYYVSDYYNTSTKSFDSSTAVLIYYNNTNKGITDNTVSSVIAYDSFHNTTGYGDNWYGPTTAMTNLPTTSQWSNVSLKNETRTILNEKGGNTTTGGILSSNFSYKDYAVRPLIVQELNKACNIINNNYTIGELNSCKYLLENTQYSNNTLTYGYWLETPYSISSSNSLRVYGDSSRLLGGYNIISNQYGVRPVIEVPISDIEY